jgi:hypothetical protein
MTGMSYMSGSKAARNVSSITNRGCSTGGSCGGDKKAGIVVFGATWSRGNMGNYLARAPQRIPTFSMNLLNTTRNPTQGTRYQVYARRGIM